MLDYLLEGEQGFLDCKKCPFHIFTKTPKRQNRLFEYVLDRKDRFLDYKNVLFTRSKNCIFAKGLTYDFSQKLAFLSIFFFFSKRQNRLFDYVLYRKDRFLDYENVLFTRSKNCIFANGLTYDFSQKLAFLSIYVFLIKTPK